MTTKTATPTNEPQALSGKARGGIPLAPQGWPFIIGTLRSLFIAIALCWTVTTVALAVLFAFVVSFFRDFERQTPQGDDLYVAPADGKVIRAEATENGRSRFEMEAGNGMKIAFTQISSLIVRRIIAYVSLGDTVVAEQRIGMIRFDSRVDCNIPEGFELNVKVGDKVCSASTILARKVEL